MRRLKAELVLDAKAGCGEGPLWDARQDCLWWVDIPNGELHRFDPATGTDQAQHLGQAVGCVVPRSCGGLVAGVRDGFISIDDAGQIGVLAHVELARTDLRLNDGKCDRAGRLWASTMAFAATPAAGSLYCLGADHSLRRVVDGISIGNGLAWDQADTTMFYIDSLTEGVDAFDFDLATGELSGRRQLFEVPDALGLPDGMCIDDDGCLWVALFRGGAVHRYTPDGVLDTIVEVPAFNITCPTFAGAGLNEMYITSAASDRPDDVLGGGVFHLDPGVSGPGPFAFAG